MKRKEIPETRKGWRRPVRFPLMLSVELLEKIEAEKWRTHRSMNDLVNEALEERFR